jgi:hypothetical protein
MTRDQLLALLLKGIDARPVTLNGGVLLGHKPFEAPMAYLHRIYPCLTTQQLRTIERDLGRKVPKSYGNFLCSVGNGARLFEISLYGSVGQLRRDLTDPLGQPISLNYGNAIERPDGLDEDTFAIGGMVGWSSSGTLVMEPTGEVLLVHHRDGREIAARWRGLNEMLEEEIARCSPLYDRTGRLLASATETMHPAGRKWETSTEPLLH